MGDAGRDSGVRMADPDTTVDGVEPRLPAAVATPTAPPQTTDYPELQQVERRHYIVGGEIAKGGMGRVVEARDLRLGRAVAIKELLPKNRDAARRFEREARITARLQHPAIIHIYEAGVWPGGEPFYAMTKVSGRSLDKVVGERKTLVERLGLVPNVIAVADALAYAHSEQVIHRDLKPANVLVGEFGETVVIDWGLAKDLSKGVEPTLSLVPRAHTNEAEETASGSVVGTPAYMPPEQARGEAVDQRADVYALGALLYKVLAGAPPYEGKSSKEVLAQVKQGPPRSLRVREPDAPLDLIAIVGKAMAREPADRYANASELAADLKRFATGQLVAARHYSTRQLMTRWLRRHRVAVAITTIASVTIAVIGVFSVRSIVDERERARSEERNAQLGRIALLEERGRSELLAGHAGAALVYLVGAAEDGNVGGARGFLIADAMRPFEAERVQLVTGATRPAIAVSPDGKHIATAGNGVVELFTPDGTRERVLAKVEGVRVLAFDPQSAQLAVAGADQHVRVWALDGTQVADLAHGQPVRALAYSPDGRQLISTGEAGSARAWDIATGSSVFAKCEQESTAPVIAASVSGNGNKVVTANDEGVACIWDRNGSVKPLLRGHSGAINSVRWNEDDTAVITASDDGTARVWGAEWGKPMLSPLRFGDSAIQIAQVSSDHRLVLTAGTDRIARIWELPARLSEDRGVERTAHLLATMVGHGAAIRAVVFSADDHFVATASADNTAKVWDAETGQMIDSFEHGEVVTNVAFAADGTRLVTASRDGTVRIWDTRAGRQRHKLFAAVRALAMGPDGMLVAGTDDTVTVIQRDTKRLLVGHLGRVYAAAFVPNTDTLITAGDDPAPILWNATAGTQIGTLPEGGPGPIQKLAVSPDGRVVALSTDVAVQIFSLAERRMVATLPGDGYAAPLAFDQNGHLLIGGSDGGIRTWTAPGAPVANRRALRGAIGAIAVGPSGVIAVAGADEARVLAEPAVTLDGIAGAARAIAFSSDGTLVITAGGDGIARVWDARKGKLVGIRDTRTPSLSALAIDGDTLWIGSDIGAVGAWNIRSEQRSVTVLEQFVSEKHVPVRLGSDDVVRRITGGALDGQRRSDQE